MRNMRVLTILLSHHSASMVRKWCKIVLAKIICFHTSSDVCKVELRMCPPTSARHIAIPFPTRNFILLRQRFYLQVESESFGILLDGVLHVVVNAQNCTVINRDPNRCTRSTAHIIDGKNEILPIATSGETSHELYCERVINAVLHVRGGLTL